MQAPGFSLNRTAGGVRREGINGGGAPQERNFA